MKDLRVKADIKKKSQGTKTWPIFSARVPPLIADKFRRKHSKHGEQSDVLRKLIEQYVNS
jgi:hypothetical protein